MYYPQMVIVGIQHSHESCSHGRHSSSETGGRVERAQSERDAGDERAGLLEERLSPWAHRGSKKYLWTEQDLVEAIAYVTDGQGEPLP